MSDPKTEQTGGRYPGGLSKFGWYALSPQERVIQYKRFATCTCQVNEQNWHPDLFESYSFDPYFNTAHMGVHSIEKFFSGTCDCVQCLAGIGIPRELWNKRKKIKNGLATPT